MNKDFLLKFGKRIKELRLANKMTQERLAEKAGIDRVSVARIELGENFPNSENLEKFAAIFNVGLPELFVTDHFSPKESLISEILSALNGFENNKVQYIYKMIMNLKNL